MQPDFDKYTLEELGESLSSIDREKYPENYARILKAIERRRKEGPPKKVEVHQKPERSDEPEPEDPLPPENRVPPEGFVVDWHEDGSIYIEYSEAHQVFEIYALGFFIILWASFGIFFLTKGFKDSFTMVVGLSIWGSGLILLGSTLLRKTLGKLEIRLTPDEMHLKKVLYKWERSHSIQKQAIKRVYQMQDRQKDSETEPSWGLNVTALKVHHILEYQEYEKSEWLGAVIAKWAGVNFEKTKKPKA